MYRKRGNGGRKAHRKTRNGGRKTGTGRGTGAGQRLPNQPKQKAKKNGATAQKQQPPPPKKKRFHFGQRVRETVYYPQPLNI